MIPMRAPFALSLPLVFVTSSLLASAPDAAAVERSPADAQMIESMRRASPAAVDLLDRGESLASAGDLQGALALLRRSLETAPSPLAHRRACEVLRALGRRQEAVAECSLALQGTGSNVDFRALVRAYVSGPKAPTGIDLFQALALTSIERRRSPDRRVAALLTCDVAESLGDATMLQHCIDELERVAPNGQELRGPRALQAALCPPVRFWAGWLGILGAVGLTLADLARRRQRWARGARWAAATVFVAATTAPAIARAESIKDAPQGGWLSKFSIDDDDPERSIPPEKDRNADPLQFGYWLQDMVLKAQHASKIGDHAASIRYYQALAKAVPDRAISYVKMCEEYEAIGDLAKATQACGDALVRDGLQVKDYTRFAHLTLTKSDKLTDQEVATLGQVIAHMKSEPNGRSAADEVECELAVRTSNVAQLRECTAALAARAPDDPKTITYSWALAVQQGEFDRAAQVVERAKELGIPFEQMARTTTANEKRHRLRVLLALAGVGLLGGAALLALRTLRRRRLTPKVA